VATYKATDVTVNLDGESIGDVSSIEGVTPEVPDGGLSNIVGTEWGGDFTLDWQAEGVSALYNAMVGYAPATRVHVESELWFWGSWEADMHIEDWGQKTEGGGILVFSWDARLVPSTLEIDIPQSVVAKVLRVLWRVTFLRSVTRKVGVWIGLARSALRRL